MKKLILGVFVPLLGCSLAAQTPSVPPPPAPATLSAAALFNADQLDQLLGPIALYPDALIALILPASTNASDVVLAARFLQGGGLPGQADLQPWDDSVRALSHYPQVIRWMDENLAWTQQLGDAFATQPDAVMAAVQRLRARARQAGTLGNTPQQQVVEQEGAIAIVPTDPNVIYVPYYDPAVVYVVREREYLPYSSATYFGFSSGFATGWWLSYGLDWPRGRVWCVDHRHRERYWRDHHRDWHRHHPRHEHDPHRREWHPRSGGRHVDSGHHRPRVTPAPAFRRHHDHDDDGNRDTHHGRFGRNRKVENSAMASRPTGPGPSGLPPPQSAPAHVDPTPALPSNVPGIGRNNHSRPDNFAHRRHGDPSGANSSVERGNRPRHPHVDRQPSSRIIPATPSGRPSGEPSVRSRPEIRNAAPTYTRTAPAAPAARSTPSVTPSQPAPRHNHTPPSSPPPSSSNRNEERSERPVHIRAR